LITVKNSGKIPESNHDMKHTNLMPAIKGIVALAAVLAPLACAADTVYKYRRPDGSVVYSDTPLRGARLIGRYLLVPQPPAGGSEGTVPGRSMDPDERARLRSQSLEAADARIQAAERALKDAQDRQQAGVEPLEGERIGNARRGSRLGPEYFVRQKQLADEVERAQAQRDEAYRLRDELRD
jgi:uncharacterized protein DUF4124